MAVNKYTKFVRGKTYLPSKKAADKIGKVVFGKKFVKTPFKRGRTEM